MANSGLVWWRRCWRTVGRLFVVSMREAAKVVDEILHQMMTCTGALSPFRPSLVDTAVFNTNRRRLHFSCWWDALTIDPWVRWWGILYESVRCNCGMGSKHGIHDFDGSTTSRRRRWCQQQVINKMLIMLGLFGIFLRLDWRILAILADTGKWSRAPEWINHWRQTVTERICLNELWRCEWTHQTDIAHVTIQWLENCWVEQFWVYHAVIHELVCAIILRRNWCHRNSICQFCDSVATFLSIHGEASQLCDSTRYREIFLFSQQQLWRIPGEVAKKNSWVPSSKITQVSSGEMKHTQ